jgi:type II restriction enzyme
MHPIQKSPVVSSPSRYLALGELKGGIDPAGADEHWKTAGSALIRIRNGFQQETLFPKTFFIAAAIAKRMADELWEQLEQTTLSNAANLTDADQVSSLAHWLCEL